MPVDGATTQNLLQTPGVSRLNRDPLRPSIRIAGSGISRRLAGRALELGCNVLGYVDSAYDFYIGVDLIAAPDIVGGGVRLKVLNALASGLPVVGTPISFRGMKVTSNVNALIVRSAEEMAQEISALSRSRESRLKIGRAARSYFDREHDWGEWQSQQAKWLLGLCRENEGRT